MVPTRELDYIKELSEFDFAVMLVQLNKSTNETIYYQKLMNILQNTVNEYSKAIDKLIDIDIVCYPEMYTLQQEVCEALERLYYKTKEESRFHLNFLGIYNVEHEDISVLEVE